MAGELTFDEALRLLGEDDLGGRSRDVERFFRDDTKLTALFEAVDGGVEISIDAVERILDQLITYGVGQNYWTGISRFQTDDGYTDSRFHLATKYSPGLDTNSGREQVAAATAQVMRLLANGRMSPEALWSLWETTQVFHMEHTAAMLAAHVNDFTAELARSFTSAQLGFADSHEADWYRKVIDLSAELRPLLFQQVWLTSALTPQEYEDASHIAVALLTELYHDVWNEGYEGHRERLRQQQPVSDRLQEMMVAAGR